MAVIRIKTCDRIEVGLGNVVDGSKRSRRPCRLRNHTTRKDAVRGRRTAIRETCSCIWTEVVRLALRYRIAQTLAKPRGPVDTGTSGAIVVRRNNIDSPGQYSRPEV